MPRVVFLGELTPQRTLFEGYVKCWLMSPRDGTDWEKAVEFLNKNAYDLVIVDLEVKLPAGFEMVKIIKLTNPNAEIIAIFNPNEYDKGRIISYGVYDFVLKPFLLRDVVGIGKKALEKKQLSDKVRNLEQIRDMDKFALS